MYQHVQLAECDSMHVPACEGAWDSLGWGEDKVLNDIPIQVWLVDAGALSPRVLG